MVAATPGPTPALLLLIANTKTILPTLRLTILLLMLLVPSKPAILLHRLVAALCRRQRQLLLLLPPGALQLLLPARLVHPLRHRLLGMLHPFLVKVLCCMGVNAGVNADVALLRVHCAAAIACAADHALLHMCKARSKHARVAAA